MEGVIFISNSKLGHNVQNNVKIAGPKLRHMLKIRIFYILKIVLIYTKQYELGDFINNLNSF